MKVEASFEPIPKEQLFKLLEQAHLAPSDHNLQPTHYFILSDVRALDVRNQEKLLRAALGQKELLQAGSLVVFCGDRKAASHNVEAVIETGLESGSLQEADAERLRHYVKFNFDQGIFGLTFLAKALFSPLLRLITPLPLLPAVHKRYWLTKQVMFAAAKFQQAASAANLSCEPIQGFDEGRIRKLLGIPWNFVVPVIMAVSKTPQLESFPKLALEDFVHLNEW